MCRICYFSARMVVPREIASALDAKVAPDDPFLAGRDGAAFVQEAVIAMLVQESHARFGGDDEGLRAPLLWVEDRFAACTACGWSCQV